jgi:iron complex outermembrane receptor protein
MKKQVLLSSASLVVALFLASPAFAQNDQPVASTTSATTEQDDESVLITAQRRSEQSRDVPISVTNLTDEQLTIANIDQLSDAMKLTPALRVDYQGTFAQPSIRGIGTAVTTSGGGPNVGIYVDGFFQSNAEVADFQLTKVKSIQVLKGPQGTLFGRNTTGGAILVTTEDPSIDPELDIRADYARFNALTLQAYASHGLGENIAFDVEGLYQRGDGFQTNIVDGDDEVGQYERWSVRAGLKANLSDSVSVLLRYVHSEADDPTALLPNAYVDERGDAGFLDKVSPGGQAIYGASSSQGQPLIYFFTPPGFFTTDPDEVANTDVVRFTNNTDAVYGTIRADLGFADLTSYTQYRQDRSINNQDLDATALQLFYILIDVDNETFSQEFLLNSKSGSRLQWTAGLNYYRNRDTWDIGASFAGTPFMPFGGSSTTTTSMAAFADLTYELTDNFFLTAGARYSHDKVSDAYFKTNFQATSYEDANGDPVSTVGLPFGTVIPVDDLENDKVTPRVVLRYKPSEQSSVYASYTKGYKAGILNVGGLSQVPVKPEDIDAFEAGYKYGDSRLSFDVAGFYYDYKNLQVSSYQNGAARITNAATSEIYGAEAQVRYRVTDDFNVFGGAAYTHARYKSFMNAPFYSYCDPLAVAPNDMACGPIGPGSLTQTTTDASGLHMQRSPEFTANIGGAYGIDLGGGRLTLSGNLYYSSSFYFDPVQQFRQDGFEVLSLRAEWVDPSERFSVALFGDNVTNNRYQTQVLFNTLGIGSVWSAPTTYGISLRARL